MDIKNSKVVRSTKKVGGLIQKGLERAGKTINNFNQVVQSTQAGIERGDTPFVETISPSFCNKAAVVYNL